MKINNDKMQQLKDVFKQRKLSQNNALKLPVVMVTDRRTGKTMTKAEYLKLQTDF